MVNLNFANLKKLIWYINGLLIKRKFEKSGFILNIGRTIINNRGGTIIIGNRACLWPEVKLSLISTIDNKKPIIKIGDYVSIGDRTQIHCGKLISIGNYVVISWDVNIIEYDYHSSGGGIPKPKPIIIEDEVWVGARCIITKGVTIGKGAIVASGAVVTKNVAPYTLVAGNPSRVIKSVSSWKGSSG